MKLDITEPDSHAISGYGAGYICIAGRQITAACVVMRGQVITGILPEHVAELSVAHLTRCLDLKPDIVLFGTGARQVMLDPSCLLPLLDAGIGYEFMNTAAACRCYNVLLEEGRRVAALLFVVD